MKQRNDSGGVTPPVRRRVRTLGLEATQARAVMTEAYDVYATACRIATAHHNAWRRLRRLHGDDDLRVEGALTKATEAALYRADAKAKYRQARQLARTAV